MVSTYTKNNIIGILNVRPLTIQRAREVSSVGNSSVALIAASFLSLELTLTMKLKRD